MLHSVFVLSIPIDITKMASRPKVKKLSETPSNPKADRPMGETPETSPSMTSRASSMIYSIFPSLAPTGNASVIRKCSQELGDTTQIGAVYKYFFGLFQFPGSDGLFYRSLGSNECLPSHTEFIQHFPSFIFYWLNLTILLGITYAGKISTTRITIAFIIGLVLYIAGVVNRFIPDNIRNHSVYQWIFHGISWLLLIVFYVMLAWGNNTSGEFWYRVLWIIIFGNIHWIVPLMILLLGPGIIPLIHQKSFIEFCL
jgi:hypothetical protein